MVERKIAIFITLFLVIVSSLNFNSVGEGNILFSYVGPDVYVDGSIIVKLTNFIVTGIAPLEVGDTIHASFNLTNFGQYQMNLTDRGVYLYALKGQDDKSVCFTYSNQVLQPGQTVYCTCNLYLDESGTWSIWPSYEVWLKGAIGQYKRGGPIYWHAYNFTVQEQDLPDLTVNSINFNPPSPVLNEQVVINVEVENVGTNTSISNSGCLFIDSNLLKCETIGSLQSYESTILNFIWTPNTSGNHVIQFIADFNQALDEINEGNNTLSEAVDVEAGDIDLEVIGIEIKPEIATVGHSMVLKPLIRNNGEEASPECVGIFYTDGIKLLSIDIPSISKGQNLSDVAERSASWTPIITGDYEISFEVDTDNEIIETDENNNDWNIFISVSEEDDTPPEVWIEHLPLNPTEYDNVTFSAHASDENGITFLSISGYSSPSSINFDYTCYDTTFCNHTSGPFSRGDIVYYYAQASDKAGNIYTTPWYNFTVKSYYIEDLTIDILIEPSEPTEIDEVTFKATAFYPYGIREIRIYVKGIPKAFDGIENSNTTICNLTVGPWVTGTTISYWADVYSEDGYYARTPEQSFTVASLSRLNSKNMDAYGYRQCFLISDLDWRAVLSLVPISIWRNSDDSISRYPALIYHEENETGFDADSTIHFLQEYSMYNNNRPNLKLTVLGDPPTQMKRLLVAPRPIGVGLTESMVDFWEPSETSESGCFIAIDLSPIELSGFSEMHKLKWSVSFTIPEGGGGGIMPMDDLFTNDEERQLREDYWSDLNVYVLCEDEYQTGLMASVFASYINAPIIFQGHYDIEELDHKSVYLIGDFTDYEVNKLEENNVNILYSFTLEELERHYVIATRTNKLILVNPLDLWTHFRQSFQTDKANTVDYLFCKHSLAAPFIASAKKEVIISVTSYNYPDIDVFVKEKIETLPLSSDLKYLTIVATPEVIPIARPNWAHCPAFNSNNIFYESCQYNDVDIFKSSISGTGKTYMTSNTRVQFNPVCSDDILVWVDEDTWGDIYYKTLPSGTEHRLTGFESSWAAQVQPAVFGTRIVWADGKHLHVSDTGADIPGTDHQMEIYMYDTSTSTRTRITYNNSAQEQPAIWDNYVVWQDYRNGNWDIYKYDIRSGEEERITSNIAQQEKPSVSWNKIVYSDNRNGNWDIYMSWLGVGGIGVAGERQITINVNMQWRPKIYDNLIVWQDNRNGNWDIYMYDIDTSTEHRITTESIDQVLPTLYEEKIAWYERSEEGWWYICIYDTSSGVKNRVIRTGVSADDGPLWLEVDGRYYGSTENLGHQDIATGRIYGVTVADASAYIARDLFFENIYHNKDALVVVREDHQPELAPYTNGWKSEHYLEWYAKNHYWTDTVSSQFNNVFFYSGHNEVWTFRYHIHQIYDDCCLIIYVDHGWMRGFENLMESEYLRDNQVYLNPVTILDLACLTGAYYVERTLGEPSMTFSVQNIRRGAMVHMGATDVSYWHNMFNNILNGTVLEDKTIGEAYLEGRNEDYDEDIWNFSLTLKGDIFYALHGDPTFKPKWW